MKEQFYRQNELIDLALVALVIFIVVFTVIAVRVYLVRGRASFDDVARLPLEHDSARRKARSGD